MHQWILKKPGTEQKAAIKALVFLVAVFCCVFFLSTSSVSAQAVGGASSFTAAETGVGVLQAPLGLPTTDIRVTIARVIRIGLGFIGTILFLLMLYGGALWMTAGGNSEQIDKAKKVITNGAIGLAIILLSYGITVFVIKSLTDGLSQAPTDGGGFASTFALDNFAGSGSLGVVLKDHFPGRDQVDIPRNSKIVITFRKPIKLDSFVQNTNKTVDASGKPLLGDCVNIGSTMSWEADCDSLMIDEDHVLIQRTDTGEKIRGAAVLGTGTNGKIYTIVIRPYDVLGSDKTAVSYKVRLGKLILQDDPLNNNPPAFNVRSGGQDYYDWKFTCNTTIDTLPPVVRSVFPADKSVEDKNSVIQLDFSKPMDPTSLQGSFAVAGAYYSLSGGVVYLKSGNSTVPVGDFVLTNGYKTLEFTPTLMCGANACGKSIYCLPVCDKAGASCPAKQDQYSMLVKAGRPFSVTSFEAIPFSGAMDLSGNALDGNANGTVDMAPLTGDLFLDQIKPDNFAWSFTVRDSIDLSAPIISKIAPGADAQYVDPAEQLKITFNKRMRVDPLYTIRIEEKPVRPTPLCRVPSALFDDKNNTTLVQISHCPFQQNGRNYYYPVITSEVEDVHFNCLFPGSGPGGAAEVQKRLPESSVCDASGKNCCPVDSTGKPMCCNGLPGTVNDEKTCLENLRNVSL
jgi:hypothetical protein